MNSTCFVLWSVVILKKLTILFLWLQNPEQITDGSLRNLYSEFTTNLVIFIVDFSNCIRTFVLLPDDFRKIQIKQCLLEMAVIYYTYWYSVRKSDIFWEIYNLDTSMKNFSIHGGEIGHLISSIFRSALSFKLLNLTDKEICLLAAMVLLSPGMFEPLNSFVNIEI